MSCPAAVMQRYTAPPEAVSGSGVAAFQIFKLVPLQSNCETASGEAVTAFQEAVTASKQLHAAPKKR